MQTQQTVLAALSLGPVGISDQLSSYPTNASATITSNVDLVLATVAATGDLLQPSYPLTPLERSIVGDVGPGIQLWGTYTAVPSSAAQHGVNVWFIAFGFVLGKAGKGTPTVTVLEADLAPMVDASCLPSPSFGDIPTASFNGTGTGFPPSASGWVSWLCDFAHQQSAACAAVEVEEWTGQKNVSLTMTDAQAILNVAPLMGGDHALLGEAGKITAVSAYRFASVRPGTGGTGIDVKIRGLSKENVTLLFATRTSTSAPFICKSQNVLVGPDGTAFTTFNG